VRRPNRHPRARAIRCARLVVSGAIAAAICGMARAEAQSVRGDITTLAGAGHADTRANAILVGTIASSGTEALTIEVLGAYAQGWRPSRTFGAGAIDGRLNLAAHDGGAWIGGAFSAAPRQRVGGGSVNGGSGGPNLPLAGTGLDVLDWRLSAPATAQGIDAGAWATRWGVTLSAEVAQSGASVVVPVHVQTVSVPTPVSADSVPSVAPTPPTVSTTYRLTYGAVTTRLAAVWTSRSGRFDAALEGGVVAHAGVRGLAWSSLAGSLWLTSQLAFMIGAGTQATSSALNAGVRIQRFAQLGMRVSTWHSRSASNRATVRATRAVRCRLRPGRLGEYILVVDAPAARSVEAVGDPTSWRPRALTRLRGSEWELPIPLAPGMYHLNVRVDGGPWRAAAGEAQVSDDFGGRVGTIVVGP
jgi:hypothetical protein